MSTVNVFLQKKISQIVIWTAVALFGALGWALLATARGEQVNTIWFLVAGVCTYAIGYRFYSLYIVKRIMEPDDNRATPAERINDGKTFNPTARTTLFGHHFAAIAGAGPLVGPVLAAQMGYLPDTLWIIFGVLAAGAVQDMLVLFFSTRLGGRSLGEMARNAIGKVGGTITSIIVFIMTMIVLAVLALICVNAMAESSWAVFSITMTLPIALLMGVYLKFIRPGKVTEVSILGFILLLIAVFGGQWVSQSSIAWLFTLNQTQLVIYMAVYCFLVAVLPVWLLLVPRDYLSTFMKVGTILVLALGVIIVQPLTQVPALTNFASNSNGPAFAGSLFPFLFITVACGALSGFHSTISSGTTPKMVAKESHIRSIGFGGMLMESFVALMAMAAAITLNQGVYYSMNMPAATIQAEAGSAYSVTQSKEANATAAAENLQVNADGKKAIPEWFAHDENGKEITVTGEAALKEVARDVGEKSIVSRTGGAPTLAVSMANILHNVPVIGGKNMLGFWYHFAVMFEALFILSAVSAGTMGLRSQLNEALGRYKPLARLRNSDWTLGNIITTLVIIGIWSALLLMGVTDPNGGIKIMYPLFGVANQLLAVVALAICSVIIVRKGKLKYVWVTAIPMVWVTIVTFTASYQKIFSSDVNLGYFKMYSVAKNKLATGGLDASAVSDASATMRNSLIQGSLSILFVILVTALVILAIWTIIKAIHGKMGKYLEDPFVQSSLDLPAKSQTVSEKADTIMGIATHSHA
ncbi:MAG: carbon starvation protein A [Candidatus Ancillula sp.]|jgi:carbon starvation protein|nr:carbon starvation protein A [Candidatus Ancillula sp.]